MVCQIVKIIAWNHLFILIVMSNRVGSRRGRDHMVVGFTTTYAINVYHHWCCEFESRSGQGVQYYVIKFVSDLQQVGGFLRVLRFCPPMKTDRHDISEILLKVALSIIKRNLIMSFFMIFSNKFMSISWCHVRFTPGTSGFLFVIILNAVPKQYNLLIPNVNLFLS